MIDDALAAFTDSLLGGVSVEPDSDTSELRDLQIAASRMAAAFKPATPDPAMARRIHTSLATEWEHTMIKAQKPALSSKSSLWDRIRGLFIDESNDRWQSKRSVQQSWGFALAGIAAILLVIILFSDLTPTGSIPGAAIGTPAIAGIAIVIGLVLGGLAWYFNRRNH